MSVATEEDSTEPRTEETGSRPSVVESTFNSEYCVEYKVSMICAVVPVGLIAFFSKDALLEMFTKPEDEFVKSPDLIPAAEGEEPWSIKLAVSVIFSFSRLVAMIKGLEDLTGSEMAKF